MLARFPDIEEEIQQIEDEKSTMTLSELLKDVTVQKIFQTMYGRMVVTHEVEIHAIQYDSRKVQRGDLFVAIRGTSSDGHQFIPRAIDSGAKAVVLEQNDALPDSYFMHAGVVKVVVPDTRVALARMAARFYDYPSRKLTMVGVTGTNGKTTTTHLIASMLESAGRTSGLIGTIEYKIGDELIPATHTTPESLELNGMLARMAERKCSAAVMEVSSHALHQHRVDGMDFSVGVFTNLTQDHLDYHQTMEKYFDAKKILFESLSGSSWAVVNIDDPWGQQMLNVTKAKKMSYGIHPSADIRATDVSLSIRGLQCRVIHQNEETHITSPLTGRFNVSNILAAFGTGIALGISKQSLVRGMQTAHGAAGRFEKFFSPKGWIAIVDYAHTPDALQKILMAIQEIFDHEKGGRIITIFGCGGNRDRAKRPIMGKIAAEMSDVVIVTSDNPRHEEPDAIIDEVMKGISSSAKVRRESDRTKAIELGLSLAQPNDVVLIAGKGHENYQIVGDNKIHFSDPEVVETFLRTGA